MLRRLVAARGAAFSEPQLPQPFENTPAAWPRAGLRPLTRQMPKDGPVVDGPV